MNEIEIRVSGPSAQTMIWLLIRRLREGGFYGINMVVHKDVQEVPPAVQQSRELDLVESVSRIVFREGPASTDVNLFPDAAKSRLNALCRDIQQLQGNRTAFGGVGPELAAKLCEAAAISAELNNRNTTPRLNPPGSDEFSPVEELSHDANGGA